MIGYNTGFAQIETLPPEQAGRILFGRSMVVIRALTTVSPLLFIAGVGILIFGAMPRETGASLFMPTLLASAFLMVFSALISMRDVKNRWLRHIARREIRRRSNSLVDSDASDAWFVEVVPKANWDVRGLSENATDVGFLSVDFQNGCLFFEGDSKRYRIPAGALVEFEQDHYSRSATMDKYGARYDVRFYFAVIKVRLSDKESAEIPFRIRINGGFFSDKSQRDGNAKLLRDIERLKNNRTNIKQNLE